MNLEQNCLTRLLRFSASLSAALVGSEDATPLAGGDAADREAEDPSGTDEGTAKAGEDLRVYVRSMRIQPVTVKVTVELAPLTDEPELQPYHPTRKLVGLAKNLASIQAATVKLDQLRLDEV